RPAPSPLPLIFFAVSGSWQVVHRISGGRGNSSATLTAVRLPFTTTVPFGHRQVVGEDTHRIFLRGVQFDACAAAEPQHLVDWHGCGAEHHGVMSFGHLLSYRSDA